MAALHSLSRKLTATCHHTFPTCYLSRWQLSNSSSTGEPFPSLGTPQLLGSSRPGMVNGATGAFAAIIATFLPVPTEQGRAGGQAFTTGSAYDENSRVSNLPIFHGTNPLSVRNLRNASCYLDLPCPKLWETWIEFQQATNIIVCPELTLGCWLIDSPNFL